MVSYIYHNNPIARPYLERMIGHHALISFQTYEELLYGVLRGRWGQRRIDELFEYVDATYDIVESDLSLAKTCADLRADCRHRGRRLDTADAWIAATAILLNCPLLSHDRDFGNPPGLKVIRLP